MMLNKIAKILKKLRFISVNTIRFNLAYFPLKIAVKLPVFVSSNVRLTKLRGKVILANSNIKTGSIQIGYGDIGIFDKKSSKSIWHVDGTVVFKGKTIIGHGSRLSINKGAELILGNNFRISAESSIVATNKVEIGNDCLISWDVLIMDTDFHYIADFSGKIINSPKPIKIGDRVWVGCRCLILKGANITSNSVIAANSTISKVLSGKNCIYGGNDHKVLKTDIKWSYEL